MECKRQALWVLFTMLKQLGRCLLQGQPADGMDDDDDDESENPSTDDDLDEETAVAHARAVASSMAHDTGAKSADTLESAMRELDMDRYDEPDDENLVSKLLGRVAKGLQDVSCLVWLFLIGCPFLVLTPNVMNTSLLGADVHAHTRKCAFHLKFETTTIRLTFIRSLYRDTKIHCFC